MKQGIPFRSIALITSFTIVVPSLTFAEPLVEPGTCELIVAARPSLEEAKQYASGISDKRFLKIFEAENGWYAVSIGALRPEEEEAVMAKWKASGKIPSDAYCSTGEKYVAGMKWAPSETTSASVESPKTNSGGGLTDEEARDGALAIIGLSAAILGAGIDALVPDDAGSSGNSITATYTIVCRNRKLMDVDDWARGPSGQCTGDFSHCQYQFEEKIKAEYGGLNSACEAFFGSEYTFENTEYDY